jgi:capsular polysaccharide biosynthesis protein
MNDAVLEFEAGGRRHRLPIASPLTPALEEASAAKSIAWIKQLRSAIVDGQALRTRFTFRGDSLWWFAELYLHRERAMLATFRTLLTLDEHVGSLRPGRLELFSNDWTITAAVAAFAKARGIPLAAAPHTKRRGAARQAQLDARAMWLHWMAISSRLRRHRAPAVRHGSIAAFIHKAFWRGADDGGASAESYIGPVLRELERRVAPGGLQYVSLGPPENFSARRWWHPFSHASAGAGAMPIEAFAPLTRLTASRAVYRRRHELARALLRSHDLHDAAVINGVNCWPIVREQLLGIALLQWPWSARAMDEAAAALDALEPSSALTYAEAGGWGRALMLEARRKKIPTVGLQHGFIYRHWLNYLHEPDEMLPDACNAADCGFPRPSVTLLFDSYAAQHLTSAGGFPPEACVVTGSARLDELVAEAALLPRSEIERAREAASATPSDALVLIATKFKEARGALSDLVDASRDLPDVRLAIKTHPAETPEVYSALAARAPRVTVLPASSRLAPLLRGCRAVVTVNSTVAVDAAVLGTPALVIGLPNNLSPFVDAGVMAGVAGADAIGPALKRILYDEEFRQQLARAREAFLSRHGIRADGRAAARAADAIVRTCGRPASAGPTAAASGSRRT